MTNLLHISVALLIALLVVLPLYKAVSRRWGLVGRVWFLRAVYALVIGIAVFVGDRLTTLGNACVWVAMAAFVANMITYNPWLLPTMVEMDKAIEKRLDDEANKQRKV